MIIELILNVVSIILDIICLGREFKIKERVSNDVTSVSPSCIQISKEIPYREDKMDKKLAFFETCQKFSVFLFFVVVFGAGILLYNSFGSLVNYVFFVFAFLGIVIFDYFLNAFIRATRQLDGEQQSEAGSGLTIGAILVFFSVSVIALNVLVSSLFIKLIIFCFVSFCLGCCFLGECM